MSEKQKRIARKLMTTHGKSYTPEYNSWRGAKSRCNNHNNPHYKNYGGRGIKMCKKWEDSFMEFFKSMGKKPTKKHTLERINNSLGYFPDNCKWATRATQNRNHRRNNLISFNGKTMCLTDWSKYTGISYESIRGRIRLGWSIEKTLTIPTGKIKPIPNSPAKDRY